MSAATAASLALREAISVHRAEFDEVLRRYGASNPWLFGITPSTLSRRRSLARASRRRR